MALASAHEMHLPGGLALLVTLPLVDPMSTRYTPLLRNLGPALLSQNKRTHDKNITWHGKEQTPN